MPNNNIYTFSDAKLVLAEDGDDSTSEGQLGSDVIGEFDLATEVGRLQKVQIRVEQNLRPYHELGGRHAVDIRPGTIRVSGSAERAHINGAMLSLLLGAAATSPPPNSFGQPTFNIVVNLNNPAREKVINKLIVFGVKFESWNFLIPEDDFVMEAITFKAIRIAVEEEGGDDGEGGGGE